MITFEKKDLSKKFFAGVFFLMGIALLFVVIFTIGSNKGFAQKKFQLQVLFKNVGGLMEGSPVRLSGVNIGNVSSIDFLDRDVMNRRVAVVLNIYSRYKKQFDKNISFSIKTEGILGEKLVEIYVLEGPGTVDLSKPIIGEDPFDVQDLAVVFSNAAESFTKTSRELSEIDMVELSRVMAESSKALLVTSEGINFIMDDLDEIAKKAKRLIDRIEQQTIEGTLFKVF
ncbi:MAG: MCE family protein [Candidatus Omnitrophica bacterium]|nr:MCE family protein [Candidatus Omnitrophota bacterium]MBU1997550.1 MCE family protein [Candidatus Omnitrophota bacterium]MBU4333667.1 MCE family protein [Candidatus Omnitrophota bacterium]